MASRKLPAWLQAFRVEGIRRKLFITLGLILVYRLLTFFPLPGVSPYDLQKISAARDGPDLVGGIVNLFSGGAFFRLSVLALGLIPYASANSFVSFLLEIFPALKGEDTLSAQEIKRRVNLWVYLLVAPFAALQAYLLFFSTSLDCSLHLSALPRFDFETDFLSALTVLVSLVTGAYLVVWIAELINTYGFSSTGFNMIVFTGVVLMLPAEIYKFWNGPQGTIPAFWRYLPAEVIHWVGAGLYLLFLLAGLFMMIYLILGRYKVPMAYPNMRRRNSLSGPSLLHFPILMSAPLDALIDAQAILMFFVLLLGTLACSSLAPLQAVGKAVQSAMASNSLFSGPVLMLSFVLLGPWIAELRFMSIGMADMLKKGGAIIPNVRPGVSTEKYLQTLFRRIIIAPTLLGGLILLLPWGVNILFGLKVSLLAGEALYFMVVFVREFGMQVLSELALHGYMDYDFL
jgi:preprotein translocase subunit SecY